jgi:hypothetical protein
MRSSFFGLPLVTSVFLIAAPATAQRMVQLSCNITSTALDDVESPAYGTARFRIIDGARGANLYVPDPISRFRWHSAEGDLHLDGASQSEPDVYQFRYSSDSGYYFNGASYTFNLRTGEYHRYRMGTGGGRSVRTSEGGHCTRE